MEKLTIDIEGFRDLSTEDTKAFNKRAGHVGGNKSAILNRPTKTPIAKWHGAPNNRSLEQLLIGYFRAINLPKDIIWPFST